MSVRIPALFMTLALTASVVVGVPLHPSDRGCTMPSVAMVDCGQMAEGHSSLAITSFGLCCLMDCQEPGPTSTEVTVRIPSSNGTFLDRILLHLPLPLPRTAPPPKWVQTSSFTPPETYLKNLALLI